MCAPLPADADPFGEIAHPGVGAGSLKEGAAPLGAAAEPLGDVATVGVGAGSLSEGVAPPCAEESALAVERGDIETKAAMPSAMAET